MRRAASLWNANADLAHGCLEHGFVQGIASGALPRERFVFYVEQDAWFLTAFARAYALGVAKAPSIDEMDELRALLGGVFEELELHRGYARQWGARLDSEPAEATLAYTDFLQRVAWSEPIDRLLAAMIPCMRLYAHLGQSLVGQASPDSPYHEWVETYADAEFDALAGRVESLLDRLDTGHESVDAHYRTAMRRELAFFDQALGVAGPGAA